MDKHAILKELLRSEILQKEFDIKRDEIENFSLENGMSSKKILQVINQAILMVNEGVSSEIAAKRIIKMLN